ncbi:MAG: hypothetical protein KAQ74_01285, partial [Dehalococcoidia bacterium]|nr:hypothetical protein [Dehalococcoidia bacterium]
MAGRTGNTASKPRQQKPLARKRSKATNREKMPRQRRGVSLKVVGRFLLVVAVVAGAVVFGPMLVTLGADLWQQLISVFGLGIILLIIAIGVLVWLIVRGFGPLARRWNVFLGVMLAGIALWVVLGLLRPTGGIFWTVTLGGEVGQAIAGPSETWAAVRASVLLVLAVMFMAPRPLVLTTQWLFRPRARKAQSAPLVGNIRPVTPTPSSRSVLPPERPIQPQEMVAAKSDEMSKAAVGVPKLELNKRGFHIGRKAQEPAPDTASVPAPSPVPVIETPVVPMREPLVTVGGWQIPPVDVLDRPKEVVLNQDEIDKRARHIEEALESYGVESKVVQINTGPTVTQFGLEPGWVRKYRKVVENGQERQEEVSRTRIRVDRITALSNDLALALAAPSIRIEAPIPGKSMVGIEVPNSAFGAVSLRSVIESTSFQKTQAKAKLALALGKGAGGESVA